MVVSLVCTASLGHQVVMTVMAATEAKVNRAVPGRLDLRDLHELLLSMDKMASKENLECGVHPA